MKKIFALAFGQIARAIVKRYNPEIIGITGSVGKTSARQAVFAVLSQSYSARTNIKNYNNEFGLPLSIIGRESPKKDVFGWIRLLIDSFAMAFGPKIKYPDALVLEYGIDRPGDMGYLLNIAEPDIAVFTSVGISHLQYFESAEEIFTEKKKIFSNLSGAGTAVLNIDDPKIAAFAKQFNATVVSYGFDPNASVQMQSYELVKGPSGNYGLKLEIKHNQDRYGVIIESVLGKGHFYSCAAAVACGVALNMPKEKIIAGLQQYRPEFSRMRLLQGIHNSAIIDDTYNAAPSSMAIALEELAKFPSGIKIAMLGDMLELGSLEKSSHKDLANAIVLAGVEYFIGVGELMKITYEELRRKHTKSENLFWFKNSGDALEKARQLIKPNSAVLVKGSQGARMEKIVKAILAHPEQAKDLVCRQEQDWLKR